MDYKEKNKLYIQHCKELGGFIFVAYEKNKPLLYDLDISDANKFRLLYLATYIDYNAKNENVLTIKKGREKVSMNKKEIEKILKLNRQSFYNFWNQLIDKRIIFEKNDNIYISKKYFSKGRNSLPFQYRLKIFIKPFREMYEGNYIKRASTLFKIIKLYPYIDKNNIVDKNFISEKRYLYFNTLKIAKTFSKLIESDNFKTIEVNDEIISKYNRFKKIGIELGTYNLSKGEEKITDFLEENKINYIKEKTFPDLIGQGGQSLRYDFYLPEFNQIIEFHGKQHKEYTPYFHKYENSFELQKEHDRIKEIYACKNKIEYLIIWYYNENDIDYILSEHLFN